MTSQLKGFRTLCLEERRQRVAELTGLTPAELDVLSGACGLDEEHANRMVENAVGVIGVPLGLCVNMRLDGKDCIVPMAVEEPSVVAAASYAAKLLRAGGGIQSEVSAPHMIGQIQLLDVADPAGAEKAVLAAHREILAMANEGHPSLVTAGGGAIAVEVRHLPPMPEDDPVGAMMVVHLVVDVRDAMGANAVNSMCETVAPRVLELTGGRVGLRILSNLANRRTVKVRGRIPFDALGTSAGPSPEALARGVVEASVFAERDPYRAATHNKGIMNGVDSVLLAFGQDWRAVEAGAHAYAARSGRYTALARWRIEGQALVGTMELPMPVGTVGGIAGVHPTVKVTRKLAAVRSAAELASMTAAVGLAQNLGALRAMAAEGIQRGHMRLHARNVAAEAGAVGDEIDEIAKLLAERGTISLQAARDALVERERQRREASRVPELYRKSGQGALLDRFDDLREAFWPRIDAMIHEVVHGSTPPGSTLATMCDYHMETGGKRLRAMLPLLTAHALGSDPERLIALGAACEMLHNATLVHDDLQDGDLVRRGRLTVWNRFGVPQAVNLGDAMFYFSVLFCQRLDAPPVRREAAAKRLLLDTLKVIDGQELEFALKTIERPTLADYFRMVEGKTSGLFALPMAGAAELCGAAPELVAGLEEAARHMGVLFQIQDDTLDLWGEKGRESVGSDIAEGKRSALVVHAIQHGRPDDVRRLLEILDKDRHATKPEEIEEAIGLLDRSGSQRYALEEIARRKDKALSVQVVDEHAGLAALVAGMSDLFLKPIETLLQT